MFSFLFLAPAKEVLSSIPVIADNADALVFR
jgi:hypothetical protein